MTCCRRVIGSLITSCMGTPLMFGGRGGRLVPNGVLGLAAESGTVRLYSSNGGTPVAFAVASSDDPAALMTGGAVGNVANGVLLNEGKLEKAHPPVGVFRVGGPEKREAMPCASKELPWGIVPIRAMICASASGGASVGEFANLLEVGEAE